MAELVRTQIERLQRDISRRFDLSNLDCLEYMDLPSVPVKAWGYIPPTPGVYFFYCHTPQQLLYIGESVNMRERWSAHNVHQNPKGSSFALEFCRIGWIETDHHKSVERELIKRFQPILNSRHK